MAAASEIGARPPVAPALAADLVIPHVDDLVDGARPAGVAGVAGVAADPDGAAGAVATNGSDGPAAAAAAAEGAGAAPTRSRRRDPVVLAAVALVLVPSIVAAVSALRHPWIPTNDWALIELRVRDVGTGDTPLLGPWSRFGWRHPGPLMFYLLALPYRLVPAEHGILFATACVNLAATIGFALVVRRYRRTQAAVALFGLAMLQRGMGIDQLSDPWNPTILIVPFALYLVLCLEIAIGRQRWAIPVAAGVATFVVQSHVGLAQPVLLLGLVAVALRWHFGRRDAAAADDAGDADADADAARADRPAWRRISWRRAAPTALVLGTLWLPPLIDQVNGTGNLGLLFRWARGDDIGGGMGVLTEGRLSGARILDGAAWLLDPSGMWVGRFQPVDVFGSLLLGQGRPVTLLWVPLVLGLVVLAARWAPVADAYRRPAAVAGILAATGVVALFTDLSTAEGAPVFWPFRWVAAIVMLIFVALGWVVAGLAVRRFPWLDAPLSARGDEGDEGMGVRRPGPVRLAGAGMVAVVALPVALAAWRGPVGRQPAQTASEALLRLRPALEEHARAEPVVVSNTVDLLNDKDLGVPVILERAGIDWVQFTEPRALGHDRYLVFPAAGLANPHIAAALATGRAELVARSGPAVDGELVLLRSKVEVLAVPWSESRRE